MNITENDLITLGFEVINVSEEEAGGPSYHYYSMDLLPDADGYSAITLLSCAHDEVVDGFWTVEILTNGHHKITKKEILENFISACKLIEDNSK